MRVRVFIPVVIVLSAAVVAAAYQAEGLSFSRPSIESINLKNAPGSPVKLFEDKDFVFLYRASGQVQDAPGFFVHAKKLNRWIEIKKLTTENSKLGRFPSGEEAALTVGKKPYAELPIKTAKSTRFPNKIKYDAEAEVYMLEFESWQNKEEYVTRFWIDRDDLEEALAKGL